MALIHSNIAFKYINSKKTIIQTTGDGNIVNAIYSVFGKDIGGVWNLSLWGDNNKFSVGENTACGDFSINLHGNTFIIGKDCMISAQEELWTDGHSVIDDKTKEVLNLPDKATVIGDHCWIGRRVTLTKGAQIPNNCIVGIGSVVTKKFIEANCVIAGNPAKVVKQGINWDGRMPTLYYQEIQPKSKS